MGSFFLTIEKYGSEKYQPIQGWVNRQGCSEEVRQLLDEVHTTLKNKTRAVAGGAEPTASEN
ncbi:hypothetical protein KGQ71_04790 [Patescibacteria group bacterium]|nr:hypothetical protein [Patescibacteria group bacterium]